MSYTLEYLKEQGEGLKEAIWSYLDDWGGDREYSPIRKAVNDLLDLIDELPESSEAE